MKAPRPHDDTLRVQGLRRYDVLDTAPDQGLDDLTTLAAYICGVPISLISLVDDDRQWFKSKVGTTLTETPRDIAFCAHAILETALFVVPDTQADTRFRNNPLVTGDTNVRFYAGMPLISPEGFALGTLCVMDHVPRELTPDQRNALTVLSRQVMSHLELRHQAHELASSEQRLFQVFASCPVSMAIYRWSDRTFIDVNAAFTAAFGWSRLDVAGRTNEEVGLLTPDESESVRARIREAGRVHDMEVAMQTRAGEQRMMLMGTELVSWRNDAHSVTTFVDITDRKRVEIASARLAAIVESSDDAIIGKNLDGTITSWNSGAHAIFGYSAAEMIGSSIMRLVPGDRRDEELLILDRIRRGAGVQHFETRRLRKDGREIDMSVTASPIRDHTGTVIGASKVARDITARRQELEAIATSETRYHALFNHAPDGIIIASRDGRLIDANPAACRMLHRSRDGMIGLAADTLVGSSDVAHLKAVLESITPEATRANLWQLMRKDGSQFAAEALTAAMPDGNVISLFRDVTERNRTDARLRRLIDSRLQGVIFWSQDGSISAVNDFLLEILGYTRAEFEAGAITWKVISPPEYAEITQRAEKEAAAKGFCTPFEKEYLRKDGSRVPVLLGAATFDDNPDEGVSFVVDLTERKKLEQQFLRAQRMESIGTLAGGIAHDLNNVLAPILMAVDMLQMELTDTDQLAILQTVHGSAVRGAELVQQVLSFARGVETRQVTVNPALIMRELLKVMRDTLPRSIDVRFTHPPDPWTVSGDPTQLHQIFMNLCVNARDAMPDGGTLTVSMENVVLDETFVSMSIDARIGDYVLVKVADTGTGIAPAVRDRIFEPFFTTKEIGKGTGLGLSTSLAIVKSHGGFINVYSEPGDGTSFKIYLPANRATWAPEASDEQAPRTFRGNGAQVLVVDDEDAIRTITRATLERFGYRVMLASNGAEGVALYAQHGADIAAVITDMSMPIMDGPSMIVAIKSMNPMAKIIASSGLASNASVIKAVDAGVQDFIPKPYTAEALLSTLHTLLQWN